MAPKRLESQGELLLLGLPLARLGRPLTALNLIENPNFIENLNFPLQLDTPMYNTALACNSSGAL